MSPDYNHKNETHITMVSDTNEHKTKDIELITVDIYESDDNSDKEENLDNIHSGDNSDSENKVYNPNINTEDDKDNQYEETETDIGNDFYNINGIWEKSEKYSVFLVISNLALALLVSFFGFILDKPEIKLKNDYRWLFEILKIGMIFILFALGLLRENFRNLQVQYTRKTFHIFSLCMLPYAAYKSYESRKDDIHDSNMNLLHYSYYQCMWTSFFLNLGIILMCKPIRKLNNFIGYISKVAFLSIDRIEDRPYTILWFISQISSVSLIETPMTIWFVHQDKFHLFWTPVFASGLGDGLAEIVGKKWGKHKYTIYALFTKKKYTRSFEGSFCVWFFSVIGISIGYTYYTLWKFIITITLLPILTTITEAISPHTWDNHFIFGIIWLFLWLIFEIF